jgi:outer membrane protein TolC
MMVKGLRLFLILGLINLPFSWAQNNGTKTLNAEQVMEIVRKHHPVVRQAAISVEKSRAEITIARGMFDPVLSHYMSNKVFDGTNYYNYSSPEILIPTWFGMEVYGGLQNLRGERYDPTQTFGQSNYLGLSVPLARDLIIDKRRAYLRQAKNFNTLTIAEQKAIINDLMMDAVEAYWHWARSYQLFTIYNEVVNINRQRLNLVVKAYNNGERPAIDTVEATAQLQKFIYQQNNALLDFQNAGLGLSLYLWKDGIEPYTLPADVIPYDTWDMDMDLKNFKLNLNELLNVADNNHPDLLVYNSKLKILNIDKQLKFQQLLPKADFRYNHLAKNFDWVANANVAPFFDNNYQYGFKLELPLRISEGRGQYKLARLKIEETLLDQKQKRLSIQLKVKNYYNEFSILGEQIIVQSSNYNNYTKLASAEVTRFDNGEGSLFLINTRENTALESLEKLIEVKAKYMKSIYAMQWSAGLLQ